MKERRHFTSRPSELRRKARLTEAGFFKSETQFPKYDVAELQRELAKKMQERRNTH